MPSVFNALASITVWTLFSFGLGAFICGFVSIMSYILETSTMPTSLPPISACFGFGIASLILSVIAMKIRKTF